MASSITLLFILFQVLFGIALGTGSDGFIAIASVLSATECDLLKTTIQQLGGEEGERPQRATYFTSTGHCFINFVSSETIKNLVLGLAQVTAVEENAGVQALARPASWGLDRIDQNDLPLDGATFTTSHTGAGVNIYVIDTGINLGHVDFGGRAVYGPNFAGLTGNSEDDHGHGTHCAGTAAGSTYGVASSATVYGVKVLDFRGSGTTSDVIAGVNWAVQNQMDNFNGEPGVLSLSLGGGASTAMNNAVDSAAAQGMVVAVAAGNENVDACNKSPAGAGGDGPTGGVISVGSTTSSDSRSSFSNYGTCVDIFAPGSSIKSTWIGSSTATRTLSGTSMACPHVAGVAATMLEKHSMQKSAAQGGVFSIAVPGKVSNPGSGSPNVLLQTTRSGNSTPLPTNRPTKRPTAEPTNRPSKRPTAEPTNRPTKRPTAEPTPLPTQRPTPPPTRDCSGLLSLALLRCQRENELTLEAHASSGATGTSASVEVGVNSRGLRGSKTKF